MATLHAALWALGLLDAYVQEFCPGQNSSGDFATKFSRSAIFFLAHHARRYVLRMSELLQQWISGFTTGIYYSLASSSGKFTFEPNHPYAATIAVYDDQTPK